MFPNEKRCQYKGHKKGSTCLNRANHIGVPLNPRTTINLCEAHYILYITHMDEPHIQKRFEDAVGIREIEIKE